MILESGAFRHHAMTPTLNFCLQNTQATTSIHGVLGQTYRMGAERDARAARYTALSRKLGRNFQADAEEGKGFLDGSRVDYVASSVTATDCKYSAFEDRVSAI